MKRLFVLFAVVATVASAAIAAIAGPASASNSSVRVPNVTGRNLAVAENQLMANRLIPVEKGGGIFGIIVKSDWQVCVQTPSAGRAVAPGSKVTVFVSRPGNC
jgi:beta-lactam-binding protein with PASTA domain